MKAIMVMYDSLNRKMLESYGCDWTHTPNFMRLAERSCQFNQSYVGSLPCMPARRELHTGRMNFMHRSWGPIEPYDDSMPEILKKNGIYTHLVSDHQHYWEDGGCTYHNRYNSWEISRGQEGDNWKADLSYTLDKGTVFEGRKKMLQNPYIKKWMAQDEINRKEMTTEEKTSQAVTFAQGLDFIERNHGEDNWFLQIETFDPHEPFYTLEHDKALYPHTFSGDDAELNADWPPYAPVEEDDETVWHVRYNYAALVSKCDRYLGKVLDMMDEYNLWEDTMLIVNTDHGFLLGEHGWWGKMTMPLFDEIVHTPLYIYDPRRKDKVGVQREALVQTIDIAPTLLEFFDQEIPKDMTGKSLAGVIEDDTPIRTYAVYGNYGNWLNVTDGRYVYRHIEEHPELPLYEYTLMPTHMRQMFQPAELQKIEIVEPFSFTKGCQLMRIEAVAQQPRQGEYQSELFDTETDPDQEHGIDNPEVVARMKGYIRECFEQHDAPTELYARMGI